MESFSYKDYIKCIHKMRLNEIMRLAEEEEIYKILNTPCNYDSKIKKCLINKNIISYLINQYLNPIEKIKTEELKLCNKPYKNKRYINDNVESIFELDKKEIYFLIYYEEKINIKLFYKILNYCIDFMQDWTMKNRKHTNATKPLLVPIIIYTGKEKWKEEDKNKIIDPYYNVIEINKIPDKELIKIDNLFSYSMLLEKSKNKKDLKRRVRILLNNVNDKNMSIQINELIQELLNEKLEKNQEKGRLQNIEKGECVMSALIERIINEDEMLVKEAQEEMKNNIVRNMLIKGLKIEVIEKVTKQSIKNIYKIKKEIENKR